MSSEAICEYSPVPAPGRIAVERRDGRTVFAWRRPLRWGLTITGALIMAILCSIPYPLFAVVAFVVCVGSDWVYSRYGRRHVLEVSAEGVRLSRGWLGERIMPEAVPLERVMGTKAVKEGLGGWSVFIMVPGHHGGYMTPGLATRCDAQWLAGAVEAEVRARSQAPDRSRSGK